MAAQALHHSDALDAQLVLRAQDGDRAAFTELFRRHAAPAWRLALAVGGSPDIAAPSVAKGFTLTLVRLQRRTTSLAVPFRHLVTRTSGEIAATASRRDDSPADPAPNDLAEAFLTLPERWRAALWLTLVEGGTAAQVAPIVGLSEEGTASLVDRAETGLRSRYARSTPLGAFLLRDLDAAKPHLRALALPVPLALEGDAVVQWETWQQTMAKDERHGLATVLPMRPWAERAISAAAAAVFAAGIAAAINLGARSPRHDAPMLASPAGRVEAESVVSSPAKVHTARGVPLHHSSKVERHSVSGHGATAGPSVAPTTSDTPRNDTDGTALAPSTPPSAPAPIEDQGTEPAPSASAGAVVADTPIAVVAGPDGVGVTVGDTTVGNATPAPPGSGVSVVADPGNGLDPIGVKLP